MEAHPPSTNGSPFSAEVRMELRTNGSVLPVAQAGDGRIVLREPAVHTHDHGTLRVTIDRRELRWAVRCPLSSEAATELRAEFVRL